LPTDPTHGEQEMSVWNGHYACTCYHPLFVFNQFGDLERCALRAGNVHSADSWYDVLKPVVARYQGKVAFKSNRQKECVKMPGKRAGSDPRPSVGVTRCAGSGHTSRLSCKSVGKTRTLMPV